MRLDEKGLAAASMELVKRGWVDLAQVKSTARLLCEVISGETGTIRTCPGYFAHPRDSKA